ncbi:3',5'-cyclic-nucleotide phosphodiesterase [Thauera linaloolentis]|uniref:Beta-lactamase n=1 Tax=Thauera linaloolentis (strain DSM 12138 / JCM 21573 / CCUG 41526 / CIP 105981 / IAM 15112 / NBRC 102519 / 47Lol) TaxID=1123367 RepID=N6XSB6_THAL4|nr:3',5'-cyclic-nucleotide phosphodiesterase [Thauera linaloolentis]ENO84631.1 beta-lactamase [Thauera linaloolentis 47Lol = DSM 12138]MCM8564264.1 3',5'-cyclic-nucleotide phosphodiesterase [Thauera linaloolentis]
MKLTVLGCSGGIGGVQARTTSLLADDDVLIDCGTGVGDLPFESLCGIDHVFLTHAHLDHIASLPLLIDAVGELRTAPLIVHALPETIRILHSHVFNWLVWPDFSSIPDRNHPYMRFRPIKLGETVRLGERAITALPAQHTVPMAAYCLDSGAGQLVFSGDTTYCPELIAAINALPALRHLIIETAFADEQQGLALASRHLCPSMLLEFLAELSVQPEVHITHLKPGADQRIMAQIEAGASRLNPRRLLQGEVLRF